MMLAATPHLDLHVKYVPPRLMGLAFLLKVISELYDNLLLFALLQTHHFLYFLGTYLRQGYPGLSKELHMSLFVT